jgi:hypothetical protein
MYSERNEEFLNIKQILIYAAIAFIYKNNLGFPNVCIVCCVFCSWK